jgi:hypothetical protein
VLPGVLCIAILLLVFVGGLNLVVDEYAKGALRTAVDEASQVGAAYGGSLEACRQKAQEVRQDLLPGPFAGHVSISCTDSGGEVVARASGYLPSLVPPVPGLHLSVAGESVVETGPAQ